MSSNRGRRFKNRPDKFNKTLVGGKAREVLEQIDETNPVMVMFQNYASQLTDKQDRYERIVKISRDITIESKRVIFLLHNTAVDTDTSKREQVFAEAEERLNKLAENSFKSIAAELVGIDPYPYIRAYTSGLQEFVEAFLFLLYLRDNNMCTWTQLNQKFIYQKEQEDPINLLFPEGEFVLGIGDFTGELMRKCINSLGAGNIDDCVKICEIMKQLYVGFQGLNNAGYRELGRKIYTLKQSLLKVEFVCYNIHVRGSEIPKHMLASVITNTNELNNEEDEGFY